MKMRNISILSLLLAVCSCTAFLAENPETSVMGGKAYETKGDLEAHVKGIVAAFHTDNMHAGNMGENLQSASGIIHFARVAGLTDVRWQCLLKLSESSTALNTNRFANHYTGINRCNLLLEGLEASPVEEDFKKEIAAEAKFYRAVLYFSLVRMYGDVPLRLERTTSDKLGCPRAHYCEVYKQIVQDLKDAQKGTRKNWAAKAMLSAVYHQVALILHVPENDNFYDESKEGRTPYFDFDGILKDGQKAWQLAYDTAVDVIDHGPYDLAYKYSDLFQWDASFQSEDGYGAWDSPERIFMIESTGAASFLLAKRSLPEYPEGASVANGAAHNRYGNWRPTRFFFQKWAGTYPGETREIEDHSVIGEESVNIEETIYINSTDPRFAISMFYESYKHCHNGAKFPIYPDKDAVIGRKTSGGKYIRLTNSDVQKRMYPYFKKYNHPTYNGQDNGVADMYFMRLAELYYIAAEAAVRLGNEDKAYDLVEVVHARARRSTADGVEAPQPKWTKGDRTGDDLVNAIVWDKLFELCAEGHEYFETHGRGATWFSEQVVKPLNEELKKPSNRYLSYKLYSSDTLNRFQYPEEPADLRKSLLCEFPREEQAYNPSLSNNDVNDFCWW